MGYKISRKRRTSSDHATAAIDKIAAFLPKKGETVSPEKETNPFFVLDTAFSEPPYAIVLFAPSTPFAPACPLVYLQRMACGAWWCLWQYGTSSCFSA
jgi:hypothetical protein